MTRFIRDYVASGGIDLTCASSPMFAFYVGWHFNSGYTYIIALVHTQHCSDIVHGSTLQPIDYIVPKPIYFQ